MATVPQEVLNAMRGIPLRQDLRGGYHFLSPSEIAAYETSVRQQLIEGGYTPLGALGTFGPEAAFTAAMNAWADVSALGPIATRRDTLTAETGILIAAIDGLVRSSDGAAVHVTVPLPDGRQLVLMNTRARSAAEFNPGNVGYTDLLHEIGHALGLNHSHAEGQKPAVPLGTDSVQYTVMSYRPHSHAYYPVTPQLYDVAVAQGTGDAAMYGVNTATRADVESVYRFVQAPGDPVTLDVNGQTFRPIIATTPGGSAYETAPMVIIWDGNGSGDRIDVSALNRRTRIDLDEGKFSSILGTNDVSIAYGAQIENATGGDGDDDLLGNAAVNELIGGAGKDLLDGRGGNDILRGGDGSDIFRIVKGEGPDTIFDQNTATDKNHILAYDVRSGDEPGALLGIYSEAFFFKVPGLEVWVRPDNALEVRHNSPYTLIDSANGISVVLGDVSREPPDARSSDLKTS